MILAANIKTVSWSNLALAMAWIVSPFMCMQHAHAVKLLTGIDEQAQLPYWEISDKNISLRLVHRLPDQTRGFFEARGFTPQQANVVARSCVFQTVFKNTSKKPHASPLQYDLAQWSVWYRNKPQQMKLREHWAPDLEKLGVSKPAQLAFEWSLMPSKQTYQPGDYNWGMSAFNLEPGSRFSLAINWHQHGKKHEFVINDIHCAADVHMDPKTE